MSYFTLSVVIIFMERIKNLYQTRASSPKWNGHRNLAHRPEKPAYYGYGYPAYGYGYGYLAYGYGYGYPAYGYGYAPAYSSYPAYYGGYSRPYYGAYAYAGSRAARRVVIHRARWR